MGIKLRVINQRDIIKQFIIDVLIKPIITTNSYFESRK